MNNAKAILATLAFALVTPALAGTEGIYEVPAGEYMDNSVMIEMERARLTFGSNQRIRLDYQLPHVIAGPQAPRFELEGRYAGTGPWTLNGEGVNAVCGETDGDWECSMFYDVDPESGLFEIDIEAAAAVVDARTDISAERATQLKDASMSLMHEAIGIIRFRED